MTSNQKIKDLLAAAASQLRPTAPVTAAAKAAADKAAADEAAPPMLGRQSSVLRSASSMQRIEWGDLAVVKYLGEGSFGRVYSGTWGPVLRARPPVALKVFSSSNSKSRDFAEIIHDAHEVPWLPLVYDARTLPHSSTHTPTRLNGYRSLVCRKRS